MPEKKRALALRIVKILHDAGHDAFIVGGAVRDMVMGIVPADYDIATSAAPDEVAGLFDIVHPVGAKYGVSMVVLEGLPFVVARFRTEGPYVDGRRPEKVEPAVAREDVLRRDFTINALMYDPFEDRIIDYVGGKKDISAGLIRTVGNPHQRFLEDRLRMLRAVRFAARFDFTLDDAVRGAILSHAAEVTDVSPERLGDEMLRMLTGPHADRALTLLDETGLLAVVLPEISAMKGVEQPPEFHPEGDVFTHTVAMFRESRGLSPSLALGILLHDVGKPLTMTRGDRIRFNRHAEEGARIAETVCRRLRFSNGIIRKVVELVRTHMHFMNVRHMRPATLRRFVAQDNFEELLELHRLDCVAGSGNLDNWLFIMDMVEKLERAEGRKLPKPLINGRDLIGLGYRPGPDFKEILGCVGDRQYEGALTSREDAIAFVLGQYPVPRQNHTRKSTPRD